MSLQKNGVSFKRTFGKAIAFSTALLTLTGSVGLSAAYDPCCPEPYCPDPCWDPCACEMPDFVVYADFLYWQVHPEGLEYARVGGLGATAGTAVESGEIRSPACELEPGFRLGMIVDLGCCEWDFYAQYTYLNQCFSDEALNPVQSAGVAGTTDLQPLIFNQGVQADAATPLRLARAEWDASYNVLDFGLGRTFSVNNCFDFRPHLGFKATWQELKYNVRYEREETTTGVLVKTTEIHNKTDFDGIGLRSGFDASWRFSPCFSVVGGVSVAAVWSDIKQHRHDTYTETLDGNIVYDNVTNLDLHQDRCALIPVTEILLGLRYDTTLCDSDIFLFVGWENQVWWNLNRFLFVENNVEDSNNFQFGPQGNVTYQGLTVRAGFGF